MKKKEEEEPRIAGRYREIKRGRVEERRVDEVIAGRYRVLKRGHVEERGVDEKGTPVLIRPPSGGRDRVAFIEGEEMERTARIVASIECRWLLPVLCISPRVVYAAPPPATRLGAFTPRDAATYLLQLCEVLARLHAAGWAGICTDVHNLRVSREGEGRRLTVVLPHLPSGGLPYSAPWSPRTSVRHDLQAAAGFFRDLLVARAPPRIRHPHELFRAWNNAPELPPLGDESLHVMITRLLAGEVSDDLPSDAASLAERLLPLAADRGEWAAIVASLPRVQTVVMHRDWDRLIELGQAELATGAHSSEAFVELPLAAAFHQRACIAYARRDLASALRDVGTAIKLDPWIRYFVTRGVVRDAMGDRVGARADYDSAVTGARRGKPSGAGLAWIDIGWEGPQRAFEGARALYARGVARLKVGKIDEACEDLGEALALTLALHEKGGNRHSSPSQEALVSLEGVIRRAQSAASREKTRLDDPARDLGAS